MKYKYTFLTLSAAFALAFSAQGAVITPQQALDRANAGGAPATRGVSAPSLVFTAHTETGSPSVYVFDRPGNNGYLLLSADDVAVPVLGYADSGRFDATNMPPQMEWWIQEYGRQIEYASKNSLPAFSGRSTRADRVNVEPLVKTRWDQTAPYSDMTPKISGRNCVTGCVATAMAQVMKYWNYPRRGSGAASITLPQGATGDASMNIASATFKWDDMIDAYVDNSDGTPNYTEAQAEAVALLMKACGYASEMNYSLGGSGTSSIKAANALVYNFRYNKNLQYYQREYLSATEWDNIIYNEIANKRPVLYGGQSTSVGHEFVCDGYRNGYYHFNWGWSGMSDGFFLLDALNPDAVGTGGGLGGGYNFGQDIIVGIQPDDTEPFMPMLTQFGQFYVTFEANKFKLNLLSYNDKGEETDGFWCNTGVSDINVNFAVSIAPATNLADSKIYNITSGKVAAPTLKGMGISYAGWGAPMSINAPSDLADGRYKLTLVTQDRDKENAPWIPVNPETIAYNFVYFTKSGNSYNFETPAPAELTIDNVEVGPLYFGTISKLSITVSNHSEKEVSQGFYPLLSTRRADVMMGEGVVVSLKPGESVTKDFFTTFELLQGGNKPAVPTEYILTFEDPIVGMVYDWSGKVTMNVNVPDVDVTISNFEILDCGEPKETDLGGNVGVREVYDVTDVNAIRFTLSLTNNAEYFAEQISLGVIDLSTGQGKIVSQFNDVEVLSQGESANYEAICNYSVGVPGQYYYAAPYYVRNNNAIEFANSPLVFFHIVDVTGVDGITADDFELVYDKQGKIIKAVSPAGIADVAVYRLDGSKVAETKGAGEIDFSSADSGVYVVKAVDADGNVKTIKIAL